MAMNTLTGPLAAASSPDTMPYLRITIEGSNGTDALTKVSDPITIRIPKELSARIAKLHVIEFGAKELKRVADAAVKAILK